MIIGLLVYVIGFYIKFLHVAWTAPVEWPKEDFREKWRFMLTRWRPDVWFWGSMVMTRNLMVAASSVVSAEPRVQLIYLVWVITTVFTLTAAWQPWRVPSLNISDILTCSILNGIGIFGLVFVSLHDEIEMNNRLGRPHVAKKQEDLQTSLAIVLAGLFGLFVAVFWVVIIWTLMLLLPGRAAKAEQEMETSLKNLYSQVITTVKDDNFEKDMQALCDSSDAYDRRGLTHLLDKLAVPGGAVGGAMTAKFKRKQAVKTAFVKTSPQLEACAAVA